MNGMATENPYNKTRVMMDEGHNVAQAAVAMNNHFRCVSNDTGSFFLKHYWQSVLIEFPQE